jgi:hypothetical protein
MRINPNAAVSASPLQPVPFKKRLVTSGMGVRESPSQSTTKLEKPAMGSYVNEPKAESA